MVTYIYMIYYNIYIYYYLAFFLMTVITLCRVPNYRLIRPSPQLHLPKLKLISAEALP